MNCDSFNTDISRRYDVVIVGGGFFGVMAALHFDKLGLSVLVLESSNKILSRASANNQARVHSGYHYPRSFLTAVRSRELQRRFTSDFPDAILPMFESIYGIAKSGSYITPDYFKSFSNRIGASLGDVPSRHSHLLSSSLIAEQWLTQEQCFDFTKVTSELERRINKSKLTVALNTSASRVKNRGRSLFVHTNMCEIETEKVVIATYSNTNKLLHQSDLPIIPFRQELVEMALVEVPPEMKNLGFTIMDGPFWSLMPYPSRGLHTLSHVRFTPHTRWLESTKPESLKYTETIDTSILNKRSPTSSFNWMIQDVKRFMPCAKDFIYRDSIWEIKTILPRSDMTDSRPIFHRRNHGLEGVDVLLGSKIDNIYDFLDELGT